MQTLAQVLPSVSSLTSSAPVSVTPPATPNGSLADYVWLHMAGLYGHKWASSYGTDPRSVGGKEWALTLAGFTQAQIDAGLEACRASADAWPPGAPEFKAMCLGIPSLAIVRLEMRSEERSPFTRATWANLDAYRFKQASADNADRMLREAYDLTREQVMRGQALPEPSPAVTHDPKPFVPCSEEAREAARRVVYGKDAAAGGDA